ncbi:MAG: molecular chaperone DnaJ [Deltaproteobacteria bacterium]|nr:MAG: molecular chaperone DnaJ [Deltaproteobacteria bacterium]
MTELGTYERITKARELLGIPEQASLPDIKTRYHARVREWHPDVSKHAPDACREMTARLNEAYETLLEYIANYRFSFERSEVEKYLTGQEWWIKRFGQDPVWGGGSPDG